MWKIFLFIIIAYTIWLLYKYLMLVYRNLQVEKAFSKLEHLMLKRYEVIGNLPVNEEQKKYLEELKELPKGRTFLERKLALNYILSKELKDTFQDSPVYNEYKLITLEMDIPGEEFNKQAMKLKSYVEIFPTSLMARFLRIKTVEFFRG